MHIGVDVSKEKLDIYNPQTNSVTTEPNSAEGFRKLRAMARKSHAIVCCEPTGGFELEMILFLQKFDVKVAYCDGYRVRHYALATGQFSKIDMHILLAQKAASERDSAIKTLLQTESKRLQGKAIKMMSRCLEIIERNDRMNNLYDRECPGRKHRNGRSCPLCGSLLFL